MTRRAGVLGAALVLEHVPDLVRYGSKPSRERERLPELDRLAAHLRAGARLPTAPGLHRQSATRRSSGSGRARGGEATVTAGARHGRFGELMPQGEYYELLAELDQFDLDPARRASRRVGGRASLYDGGRVVGSFAPAHAHDESLQAPFCSRTSAARRAVCTPFASCSTLRESSRSRSSTRSAAARRPWGIATSAAAARSPRRSPRRRAHARRAGRDVKAFCAAPVHALIIAAALVESGAYERVVVVAGGSLAKLGMKFQGALDHGVPMLEDVLAGMAVLVGPAGDDAPVLRLDAVGRHRIGSGSSQQALLSDIVVRPLEKLGCRITDVARYSTELHDPEITEPAGGGDVPDRNYRMLAGLAVMRGELDARRSPASRASTACPASRRRRGISPRRCRGSRTRSSGSPRASCARRCSWRRAACSSAA